MFRRARARRCCEVLPSFHCCTRATFATVARSRTSILLRSSCQQRIKTIHSSPVFSRLVARYSLKSTPRNLRLCRSPPHFTPTCETSSHIFLPPNLSQRRTFSSTPAVMTATKIDGTAIAKQIREKIHTDIENAQKINPRYKPSLKIIQGIPTCPPQGSTMLTLDSQWVIDQIRVCSLMKLYTGNVLKISSYLCSYETESCRGGKSSLVELVSFWLTKFLNRPPLTANSSNSPNLSPRPNFSKRSLVLIMTPVFMGFLSSFQSQSISRNMLSHLPLQTRRMSMALGL